MDRVAVAILNWNGEKLLSQFLPSVIKFSPKNSVYVIDNGSKDQSREFLAANFPEVNLIELEENFGFSEGYNRGLASIDCDIAILLNSDVELTQNWIEPILKDFSEDPEIAAIQPKILSYNDKTRFEYAGASGGFIDSFGYPFCRGRLFSHTEKDLGQYDEKTNIFWASGACLAIRKEDYFQAGGLDPIFFAHMEEIDLCWRLHRRGRKIICQPKSMVYHLGGGSLPSGDPRKTYLNFRNNLILLAKNLKGIHFYPILFGRLMLDGLAGLGFLMKGNFREFLSVIKAHLIFYTMLGSIRKTNGDSSKTRLQSFPGVFWGLLPWQFFIKKRKTFTSVYSNNPKW